MTLEQLEKAKDFNELIEITYKENAKTIIQNLKPIIEFINNNVYDLPYYYNAMQLYKDIKINNNGLWLSCEMSFIARDLNDVAIYKSVLEYIATIHYYS